MRKVCFFDFRVEKKKTLKRVRFKDKGLIFESRCLEGKLYLGIATPRETWTQNLKGKFRKFRLNIKTTLAGPK